MKPFLITLTLIAGCATLATPALAQSALQQGNAAVKTTTGAAAAAPKSVASVSTGGIDARAPVRTPGVESFNAAGSVIILADGIVANATIAQILPPAPGFVFDR